MSILEVKNLCKKNPAFELKNVSFSLQKGKITGFIGRNGAGKSTTLKSLRQTTKVNIPILSINRNLEMRLQC